MDEALTNIAEGLYVPDREPPSPPELFREEGFKKAQSLLDYLGYGNERVVFGDKTRVVKFPVNDYGRHANEVERTTWEDASDKMRQLLVPVRRSGDNDLWIVMDRVNTEGGNVNEVEGVAEELGVHIPDIEYDAVGRVNGKSVVYDYGMGVEGV